MNYIELEDTFPLDLTTAPDRTFDKLHLSTIYTAIEKQLFGGPRITDNKLWAQFGFLFERVLADCFAVKYPDIIRPGEIELDGILMSPDGINFAYNPPYLEEYKCTWKSSKLKPWDVWRWMTQVKGYCKGLEVKDCIFRILHWNGDYSNKNKEWGPEYKCYVINFTQNEIDDNWKMILNYKSNNKGVFK